MVMLRRRGVRVRVVAGGRAGLALDVEQRRRRQEARAAQRQPVLAVARVAAVAAGPAVAVAVAVLAAEPVRVRLPAGPVRGRVRRGQRLPLLRVGQRRAQRQRPLRQVGLALWNQYVSVVMLRIVLCYSWAVLPVDSPKLEMWACVPKL